MATEVLADGKGENSITLRSQDSADGSQSVRTLHAGHQLMIGRSRDCDWVLEDETVSRHQCCLSVLPDLSVSVLVDPRASKSVQLGGDALRPGESAILTEQTKLKVGRYGFSFAGNPAPVEVAVSRTGNSHPSLPNLPGAGTPAFVRDGTSLPGTDGPVYSATHIVENAEPLEPERELTRFVPPEKAKIVIETARKKRKHALYYALIALLGVAFWLLSSWDPTHQKHYVMHRDERFSVQVREPYRVEAKGPFLLISQPDGRLAIWHRATGCRWWDHEKAVDELNNSVHELPEEAAIPSLRLSSQQWFNRQDMVLGRSSELSTPYARVESVPGSPLAVAGRIYISDDSTFAALAWGRKAGTSQKWAEAALETFDPWKLEPDGIDRRPHWAPVATSGLVSLREDAARRLASRDEAPENAWLAYEDYMRLYRFVVEHGETALPSSWDKDRLWQEARTCAAFVDWRFKKRRNWISAANKAGKADAVRSCVEELKAEILDETDYRWRWAQKQLHGEQQVD